MAPPSGMRPPLPRATISVNAPAAALTPLKPRGDVEAGRAASRTPSPPPLSPKMKAAVWVAGVLLVASVATLVAVLATQVTNQSSSNGSGTHTPSPPPQRSPRSPPPKAPSTSAPATGAPVQSPQSAAPSQAPTASSPPPLRPPPPPAPPVEVPDGFDVVLLSDEFDGSALDTTKWAFDPDTDQQTSEGLQVGVDWLLRHGLLPLDDVAHRCTPLRADLQHEQRERGELEPGHHCTQGAWAR